MQHPYGKQRIVFNSDGYRCAGVLYRPSDGAGKYPCVVMAHGFTGTMDWIVGDFAEVFANGGLAALIFDYRYLGSSDGEPRQLIDSRRQRQDLLRAVEFVRASPGIDASRIALWGTSLGGSHVVNCAVDDPDIAAVVANVPGLDLFVRGTRGRFRPANFRPSKARVTAATIRLIGAALLDAARGAVGQSPYYIPVYGSLGKAVFSDPALADLFAEVEQNAPSWRNRVTPRFFFTAPRYRDGTIERIMAPLLVTVARDDAVVSSAFVKETAAKAPHHEIREYPVGHFDMYHGAVRDEVAQAHLEFLQHHLMSSAH
ncbi:peptidase S15 [Mycolicibacterium celeriflavum]|uniref:alpha/beta hydrolase n=1 Tax=Mycolicibacterium celeriflavum TaxID=1249101 RepID=UPI0007FE5900|nr:alpha/beta hydrolase [Mycolicibacterium celeriflavum]OBG19873.1 peptidase S15 [Mycolicibacterium celeriflavum]